jgi:hypothetical protein
MPTPAHRANQTLAACVGLGALVAILLRVYPPHAGSFYPACPFFQCTGLLCPGCGATHALSALVRGDLHEAVHQNALLVLLLPSAILYGLIVYSRALRGNAHPWPHLPRAASFAMALSALVFAIARNLH